MDGKNIIFCSITSLHEVGRIYGFLLDAHKKPCIMIDKEILLLKSYLLELLINNRYTHKEKNNGKSWNCNGQ